MTGGIRLVIAAPALAYWTHELMHHAQTCLQHEPGKARDRVYSSAVVVIKVGVIRHLPTIRLPTGHTASMSSQASRYSRPQYVNIWCQNKVQELLPQTGRRAVGSTLRSSSLLDTCPRTQSARALHGIVHNGSYHSRGIMSACRSVKASAPLSTMWGPES